MVCRNFAKDRGLVLGLLKSFFGISASVITVVYQTFFRPDVGSFLLFLSWVLPAGALIAMLGATVVDETRANTRLTWQERTRVVVIGYGLLVVFVLYLTFTSWYQSDRKVGKLGYGLFFLMALFLLLLFPIRTCDFPFTKPSRKAYESFQGDDAVEAEEGGAEAVEDDAVLLASDETAAPLGKKGGGKNGSSADKMFKDVVKETNFWLLFIVYFTGIGSGITLINNIGNLVKSMGGLDDMQDGYVVTLSVGNCCGRALAGLLSDKYKEWSRQTYLLFFASVITVAQMSLCISNMDLLYLSCLLSGIGYGAYWSLLPIIVGDTYGSTDLGKIYSFSMLAPLFGSVLWSSVVASAVYNSHAVGTECEGSKCYQATFLFLTAASLVGTVCALKLKRNTDSAAAVRTLSHSPPAPVLSGKRVKRSACLAT